MESGLEFYVGGYKCITKGVPKEVGQEQGKKQCKKPRKNSCIVPGCGPTNLVVHRIPKNDPLRGIWIRALGLQSEEVKKTSRICEIHFSEGDYGPGKDPGTRCLSPTAVPCFPNLSRLLN